MGSSGGNTSTNSMHDTSSLSNSSVDQYMASYTELFASNYAKNSSFNWPMNSEQSPNYNSSFLMSPSASAASFYLSPSVFLDSPAPFHSSNDLQSPALATIPGISSTNEDHKYADLSFQSQTRLSNSLSAMYSSSAEASSMVEPWKTKHEDGANQALNRQTEFSMIKTETAPGQSLSQQVPTMPANHDSSTAPWSSQIYGAGTSLYVKEQRLSEDGYSWRKYGQKQVKGTENPRSYYKCTFPNCPTKKKVERNLDGHVTEVIYKGSHSHPKPPSKQRTFSSSNENPMYNYLGTPNPSNMFESLHMESEASTENLTASFGGDDVDIGSSKNNLRDADATGPEAKRWKGEDENWDLSASGSSTIREPRIVVQTTSDIDILDDGYRWRKYGQKVVKGNSNPRSYYKCTNGGCPVRKLVERASHDLRAVITTYEGRHNHDVPAARGSVNYIMNRQAPVNRNTASTALCSSGLSGHSSGVDLLNQASSSVQMLQDGDTVSWSYRNSVCPYGNQMQQAENALSKANEKPKDYSFFNSNLN